MAINGVSEDEAREQMMDAERFRAQLAAITAPYAQAGSAAVTSEPSAPPADYEEEDDSDLMEELDAAIEATDAEEVDLPAIRASLRDMRARMGPVNAH